MVRRCGNLVVFTKVAGVTEKLPVALDDVACAPLDPQALAGPLNGFSFEQTKKNKQKNTPLKYLAHTNKTTYNARKDGVKTENLFLKQF